MDNITGGQSAVIQVTFLMEDRGFCKDVFSELPLEFAVEAQKLLAISLEHSVG